MDRTATLTKSHVKLTQPQLRALKAVYSKEVSLWIDLWTLKTRIHGERESVIERLHKMGLVSVPNQKEIEQRLKSRFGHHMKPQMDIGNVRIGNIELRLEGLSLLEEYGCC